MKHWLDSLFSDQHIKDVVLGTGLTYSLKILGAILSFIVSVLITRSLGIDDVGIYFLAFAILIFIASLTRLGAENALLKFAGVAHKQDNKEEIRALYITTTLRIGSLACLIGGVFYFLSPVISEYIFSKPDLEPLLKLIGLGVVPIALYVLHTHIFLAIGKVALAAFHNSVLIPACMILGILILRVFDLVSAQLFYLSYITACVVTLISCYVIYSRLPYRHVAKQSANPAFWPTSYVMYGMLVFDIIAVNLPQILTGYFLSSADVGLLAVCIRITNLVAFLLTAMTGVMGPKIAQLYADQDIENTRRVLTMLVYMALLFSTTVCITLVIFDDQILGLFGGDYVAAKTVLHLLAVSQVFLLINGIGKLLLQMSAHEKSARRISVLYAVSLLLCMVVLTPLFGIEGTAMAMMLISFMSMLVSIIVVKKQMGLFLFAPGWRVVG